MICTMTIFVAFGWYVIDMTLFALELFVHEPLRYKPLEMYVKEWTGGDVCRGGRSNPVYLSHSK